MVRTRLFLPLLVVLALAGCGSVKEATDGPIDTPDATNPIDGIKDASLANCVAANVQASFTRTTEADSIRSASVKLTARDKVSCVLVGAPTVALRSGGTVVPSSSTTNGDQARVVLEEGDSAYFDLDFPTSAASATCTEIDSLAITAPGDDQTLLLPFDAGQVSVACPNMPVTVSTLRADA